MYRNAALLLREIQVNMWNNWISPAKGKKNVKWRAVVASLLKSTQAKTWGTDTLPQWDESVHTALRDLISLTRDPRKATSSWAGMRTGSACQWVWWRCESSIQDGWIGETSRKYFRRSREDGWKSKHEPGDLRSSQIQEQLSFRNAPDDFANLTPS